MKIVLLLAIVMLLCGCADHVTFAEAATKQPVGFLHGIWHGWIFTFSFIVSLFSDDTTVYAIYNNGGWYNFGYFLGLGGFTVTCTKCKR